MHEIYPNVLRVVQFRSLRTLRINSYLQSNIAQSCTRHCWYLDLMYDVYNKYYHTQVRSFVLVQKKTSVSYKER